MENDKRIPVITGFGVVCNLGIGKDEVKKNLYDGTLLFSKVSKKGDYGPLNNLMIGLSSVEEPRIVQLSDYDKSEIMLRLAADEACRDAGIAQEEFESLGDRATVSLATSLMGSDYMINYVTHEEKDPRWLLYSKAYAMRIARQYGIRGGVYTTSSACASGTAAVGVAMDLIREGECDIVLCGGADHISEISLNGFELLGTCSNSTCRPFDKSRDGINIGEGSAFFIIEDYEHARKRNAHIYGELKGYGLSNDAYHITSPDPEGMGAFYSMSLAIADNEKNNIYINAHGTGTHANDDMEIKAVGRCFPDEKVYVSSTKALTGHCLGAAGSIELAFGVMFMEEGKIPCTVHSACDIEKNANIDFVIPENYRTDRILSNSFAFGGNDASVLLVRT